MESKGEHPERGISSLNRVLRYIRTWGSFYYYRYSVEIGISALEGWEACIVNSIFLLLIASVLKYGWSILSYLFVSMYIWMSHIY